MCKLIVISDNLFELIRDFDLKTLFLVNTILFWMDSRQDFFDHP